jgi:hypothetical protein
MSKPVKPSAICLNLTSSEPAAETPRRKRFRAECFIFIGDADTGHQVWPVRSPSGVLAFGLRWRDGTLPRWRVCQVTHDAEGTRCDCGSGPRCEHIRALRFLNLIPRPVRCRA